MKVQGPFDFHVGQNTCCVDCCFGCCVTIEGALHPEPSSLNPAVNPKPACLASSSRLGAQLTCIVMVDAWHCPCSNLWQACCCNRPSCSPAGSQAARTILDAACQVEDWKCRRVTAAVTAARPRLPVEAPAAAGLGTLNSPPSCCAVPWPTRVSSSVAAECTMLKSACACCCRCMAVTVLQ